VFGPSLNPAGALPCFTQRHQVAGLTGIRPGLSFVVARSLMRITRCAIDAPSAVLSVRRGGDLLPLNARRFRLRQCGTLRMQPEKVGTRSGYLMSRGRGSGLAGFMPRKYFSHTTALAFTSPIKWAHLVQMRSIDF
jgi:hypothetical protein